MEVVETLRGIMDGFDSFYDSTAAEETDESRKKALAAIVRSKANGGGANARDAVTGRLIDLIVPKMTEKKPVSASEVSDLLLGVLETSPAEYNALREGARELDNKTNLDALTLTGLRYVEAQRFKENKDWFDGTFIHLPEVALLKAKRKQKERWVRVSPRGSSVLQYFFAAKALPSYKTWMENLERWARRSALDPVGLSPKTTRKTWESWLVSCYPERTAEIFLSQGHTTMTSLHHYLNMPFLESDKEQMLEWTGGLFEK